MLIFLGDEFLSIGEIKKGLQLYELQLDNQLSFSEGENMYPDHVIKNSTPVSQRDTEN